MNLPLPIDGDDNDDDGNISRNYEGEYGSEDADLMDAGSCCWDYAGSNSLNLCSSALPSSPPPPPPELIQSLIEDEKNAHNQQQNPSGQHRFFARSIYKWCIYIGEFMEDINAPSKRHAVFIETPVEGDDPFKRCYTFGIIYDKPPSFHPDAPFHSSSSSSIVAQKASAQKTPDTTIPTTVITNI
jgi:hypothetical protein